MSQLAAFVLFKDNIHPLGLPVTPGDTFTLYSSILDLSLNFTLISTGHSHLFLPTFFCMKYWKIFYHLLHRQQPFFFPQVLCIYAIILQILLQTHVENIFDSFLSNFLHPTINFDNVRMTYLSLYNSKNSEISQVF